MVLNFWASWCGPCKEEMPMFVAVQKEWSAKGIPAFLQKYDIDFPVWKGTTRSDLDRLKMGEAVPASAFLDEQGNIFARVQGEISLPWITSDRKSPKPKPILKNY